jgi:hypothetical protein
MLDKLGRSLSNELPNFFLFLEEKQEKVDIFPKKLYDVFVSKGILLYIMG